MALGLQVPQKCCGLFTSFRICWLLLALQDLTIHLEMCSQEEAEFYKSIQITSSEDDKPCGLRKTLPIVKGGFLPGALIGESGRGGGEDERDRNEITSIQCKMLAGIKFGNRAW